VTPGDRAEEAAHRHVPRPSDSAGEAAATTPGGYSYTVVDDSEPTKADRAGSRRRRWLPVLAAALIPAAIVGALVWVFAPGGESQDDRVHRDVTNVLNAFSSSQEGTTTRFEGELPPGFPDDLPVYPGARVLASLLQVGDSDAGYLVIYDTDDARADVAAFYDERLSADPWQVDAGQDGRDTTAHQFSKIDDPNIAGVLLIAESKDDELTTIVASVQVVAGAEDLDPQAFVEPPGRALPQGFPPGIPVYDGAVLIESAFQRQAGARNFALSFITRDDASDVLDFYRDRLEEEDLSVEDAGTGSSSIEDAEAIRFADAALELTGEVAVGAFSDDENYTRIDLQVSDQRSLNDD
jgi:hypothetical protein